MRRTSRAGDGTRPRICQSFSSACSGPESLAPAALAALRRLARLPSARPSRDRASTARAVAPSARTICGSAPLAQLDAEMAAAYVAAKVGLPAAEQAKVTVEQHEWLRRRNACGADASCLERTLTERLGQLQTSAAGPAGIGAAPAVQDMPPAFSPQNPAPAATAAEQRGDSAAAIAYAGSTG